MAKGKTLSGMQRAGKMSVIGRREFLGRAAWAVTAAAMGGAVQAASAPGEASLVGFVAPKLEKELYI